jgi:thioredoxin 1
MYRILDELDAGYGDKVKTERINLLENRETAAEFKVRFVPHLLFCDGDGKIVKEQVGYASLDKVLTIFKDAGINLE